MDPAVAPQINDLLQVKVLDDPNSLTYHSRIDDLVSGKVVMSWPTERGIRVPIHLKQELSLTFLREDAVYSFKVVVEDRNQQPIPQLRVRPLTIPERTQRRQFFRVRTALPVELTGTVPDGTAGAGAGNVLHIVTTSYDLSGSGVSIRHGFSIPTGTLLQLKLTLPGEDAVVKALAKVVCSESIALGGDKIVHHVGMYFLSIAEAQRSRLVRHVFRVQQTALAG
jgi:c-di-GMP-binding flagellar brake protein YcgR